MFGNDFRDEGIALYNKNQTCESHSLCNYYIIVTSISTSSFVYQVCQPHVLYLTCALFNTRWVVSSFTRLSNKKNHANNDTYCKT